MSDRVKINVDTQRDVVQVRVYSNSYTLPTATDTVKGGVKIGAGVTITDGVISVSTDYAATNHTHLSEDITDAGSPGRASLGGKLAKYGAYGGLSSIVTTGIGFAGNFLASSLTGLKAGSESGASHAVFEYDDTGNNRSFVARLLGAFGWWRGAYNLTVSAVDTLTANRVQRFSDKDGTIALTSDITGTNSGTNTGDQDLSVLIPKGDITTDATGARTLALTDAWDYIRLTHAAANALTIPTNATVAIPVGTEIYIRRGTSAGAVTLSNAGVTVNGGANVSSVGQSGNFALKKIATDEWDFI